MLRVNPLVQTDSYKVSHSSCYPENMDFMFDYVEARKGGKYKESVFFGLQMFIKEYLENPFTQEDIDEAVEFYNMHFPPVYANEIFDREMFQYILDEYSGYFPVKIKAVPEGTVIPEGNVLCTFECNDPKAASIVSFLETMATSYIWYGTTVATNSYQMKKIIKRYGEMTADTLDFLPFALHDFGARGVSPGAQGIGGAAHLVNFMGSDNLEAVYKAQKLYGVAEGLPGYSIPATEHSVMSSEGRYGEMKVAERVFDTYAKEGGMIAMVNDTYNMENHIKQFSKIFKEKYLNTGVRWITRPDSGYPPEMVVKALDILWDEFVVGDFNFDGTCNNEKGFKMLPDYVRVIQGDGIDIDMIELVLEAVKEAGYSTENVAFGSGGGLLQKVDRDTLRFAMKASYIEIDGKGKELFKEPNTQTGSYNKKSKKGKVGLYKDYEGRYLTMTEQERDNLKTWPFQDMLEVVYDGSNNRLRLAKFYTFDEVRANAKI